MFQATQAHEWMNDAHVHEMQVQMWKANTWGVTGRLLALHCVGPSSVVGGCLKALVWFWLIDETLSANLVYQSNYEICSTTPSGEANEDHSMMMMMPW